MLYICIPAYNEAPTIGVLLWRIRAVFQEYAREYELVVYDDASTDATAEVLEPYTRVLPLTVLRGETRRGYAAAVDALSRHVAAHTRYPRRDAMIVLQGDFTDRPEHIPELVKRFEGGADIVVAERSAPDSDPIAVRRLRRAAPWMTRAFVGVGGVADLTSGYRLIRISLLRDLLRERGDRALVGSDGWAANAELLVALAPFARRIETTPVESRFDVRPRETRIRPLADALALFRYGWRARGNRAVAAGSRASTVTRDEPRPAATAPVPELALTDGSAPIRDAERSKRRRAERAERAERPERPERSERAERTERADRSERAERPDRAERAERRPRSERADRTERPDRPERPARPERPRRPAPAVEPAANEANTLETLEAEETSETVTAEGAAAPERKRRKRTRRRGEKRERPVSAEGVEAAEGIETDVAAASADTGADETSIDTAAGEGEDAPRSRTSRRRRRGRGRRAAGEGANGESDASGEDAGADNDGVSAEGASDAEGAPARGARRSRRGKRRGRRSGAAREGAEAAEGGESSTSPIADGGTPGGEP